MKIEATSIVFEFFAVSVKVGILKRFWFKKSFIDRLKYIHPFPIYNNSKSPFLVSMR